MSNFCNCMLCFTEYFLAESAIYCFFLYTLCLRIWFNFSAGNFTYGLLCAERRQWRASDWVGVEIPQEKLHAPTCSGCLSVSHCNALFDSQLGCRPPFYHIAGNVDCICVQLNCVLSRFAVTCAHANKAALSHTHTHVSAFAFALFSLDAMSAIRKGKKEQEVEEENATCTEEVQQNRLKQLKWKGKHTL